MATTAEIDEQVRLEREAIRCGIERLRENTRKLEKRSYASSSVYGKSSIEELMPVLVERIASSTSRIYERKNGQFFSEIHKYLSDVDAESMALVALKVIFDNVFSYKEDNKLLVNVAVSIGASVENECQMRFYETKDPDLLKRVKRNYWHSSAGTQQKVRVTKLMMNRADVVWPKWGNVVRAKLGGWLVDCVLSTSGWFITQHRQCGQVTRTYLVPSSEFLAVQKNIMQTAELFAPIAWPMLIEPNDWSHDRQGGYLLNEVMRGHSLVRQRGAGGKGPLRQGEAPIAFLNKLQKVSYRLNPFVVKVAEELSRQKVPVGKFIPMFEIPLPAKPPDIAECDESRKSYRREAAEVMNQNAAVFRRSCRTRMTMELISRFKDRERFYVPWSFDYRGRVYPIPALLTPQDTDFGKALLRFSEEAPKNDEAGKWLAFQVATTYGLDKSTMEERLQWAADNGDLISRIAVDPLGNRCDWEAAEEPWQFLAACEEYYNCVLTQNRQTTGLPVAVDATCSGLQILAGLARDESTARLVNVFPGEKPQDAYLAVAEEARTLLPGRLAALLDRKVTKRTVMTIPYNAKEYSNRQYIKEALKEKKVEFSYEDVQKITKAVVASMNKIVPGPMGIMKWVNDQVREALKSGKTELQWTTPSGFVVNQRLMKPNIIRVRLQVLGSCKMNVADGETDDIDKNRHKAATAPNLIHSLDASLLHIAFQEFNNPFTVIHDSVLCRATDMGILNHVVRDAYSRIFARQDYLSQFAAQIDATDPPPVIGDFDPDLVLNSTYFFC